MRSDRKIRVWRAPIALGVITAIGLVTALLSDTFGDVLSWLALAAPVAVVFWCAPRRMRVKTD